MIVGRIWLRDNQALGRYGEFVAITMLPQVIDLHVHSSPDVVPRSQDDLELTASAATAGMRGLVLKSHHFPTAARARLAADHTVGLNVWGGLALNHTCCGGLNAAAVQANLAIGGRVVWLPTVSAAHHLAYLYGGGGDEHLRQLSGAERVVEVLGADGRPLKELRRVLDVIADHDAVLASGHLAPDEIVAVFACAREHGVRRLLVNHVDSPITPVRSGHAQALERAWGLLRTHVS